MSSNLKRQRPEANEPDSQGQKDILNFRNFFDTIKKIFPFDKQKLIINKLLIVKFSNDSAQFIFYQIVYQTVALLRFFFL